MSEMVVAFMALGRELVPYEKENHGRLVYKFIHWARGQEGRPVMVRW